MKFYKYTPALLDPQTLEDTLIGRDLELDNLKRILKSASSGKSFSHPILVGPKGIGKTHILRIIYHAVKGEIKTKGLNVFKDKFIPVIFSEEEYPGSVTKFLILALHYLNESKPEGIPPVPRELMDTVTIGSREKELVLSYIKTFKKKTGKILLILVDNLNDIMERFTDEDQSSLREVLMTYDSILLMGAAPTLFDSIINHDKPFYNFFEIIWLKDLSFEDTVILLKRYAELEEKSTHIEEFKEKEVKLRAMHELAGGNPRLILSLYHIIVEGDITSVEDAFLKLLDELSPYFRERMKDLSEQQKEIIDVMARAKSLLTPTEIAGRCQMQVNLVNSQLKRLEKTGYVQIAKKHAKKVFYDFNERLFSLWRQMRVEAGRKRLGFIVRFLELWFTKEELYTYLDRTLNTIRGKLPLDYVEIQHDLNKLWYLKEAIPEYKGDDAICVLCEREAYDVALKMINQSLKDKPNDWEKMFQLGCIEIKQKNYDKAVQTYKKLTEMKPDKYKAWSKLGYAYRGRDQLKEAIEAFRKAIDIKPDDYETWNDLGITYGKLKRDDAIAAFKKAIEIKPDGYEAWGNLGLVYQELDRHEEAIEAYKKSIDLEPNEAEKWRAWYSLALSFLDLKKYTETVEACKRSIELRPDENCAWYNMGKAYYGLKDFSNALLSFKKATEFRHCKNCTNRAWFMLCITYISIFIDEGGKGNIDLALNNLRESFNCLPHISGKDKPSDVYAKAFKNIIQDKKIDLLKTAIKEIALANQPELLELLSPYATLIKYLDTKDPEIIDRLRHEERIVVEDMLKMLGEKTDEKPKKLKQKVKNS